MGDSTGTYSPLVLDLDGDGVELTALAQSGAFFDLDVDGFAEQTGWVGPDDGLLALDRDGNGVIGDNSELFGTAGGSPDGFATLAELDTNGDGVIDVNDPAYSQLRVWRDADTNGWSGTGELMDLATAGVVSIGLAATTESQTIAGNRVSLLGSFLRADGSTGAVADVWFQADDVNTIALNPLEDWEYDDEAFTDVFVLPEHRGYGTVPDLSIAMLKDASLRQMVQAFVAVAPGAEDWAEQTVRVQEIVYRWTGVSDVAPDSRGEVIDARILEAAERLTGSAWEHDSGEHDPYVRQSRMIMQGWTGFVEGVQARLLAQGPLAALLPGMAYDWSTDSLVTDDLGAALAAARAGAPLGGAELANYWTALVRTLDQLNPGVAHDAAYEASLTQAIRDSGLAGDADDFRRAEGTTRTFAFDLGMGDRVVEGTTINWGLTGIDAVLFGPGVDPATVRLERDGGSNNLRIVLEDGSSLTIQGQFSNFTEVEAFRFQDAAQTAWTAEDVALQVVSNHTSTGDDTIHGYAWADALDGGVGNDTIFGKGGNDTLNGGAGNDTLVGDSGDDVLDGGMGNDTLNGGVGNDTYLFDQGSSDRILDQGYFTSSADVLRFGPGISASDLVLSRAGAGMDDLVLSVAGTADSLTIEGYFNGSTYRIESFIFADGTAWTHQTILDNLPHGTPGDDSLYGTDDADILDGGAGNDTLDGREGNDTYVFDRGYGQDSLIDVDYAAAGNRDTVAFGPGISAADLVLSRAGSGMNDLVLSVAGTTDKLTIQGYFSNAAYRIEDFTFTDGTHWDYQVVVRTLSGGTPGADNLIGTTGSDLFDGGAGNDRLEGRAGNDTYIFDRGYGQDSVIDMDYAAGNRDTVAFGPGISAADLVLSRAGSGMNDLVLSIAGTTDKLTIQGYFGNAAYRIEDFTFADGTSWDTQAVVDKILTGTPGDDNLIGTSGSDTLDGGDGNDRLEGRAGNDTYVFDRGYGQDSLIDMDYAAGNRDTVAFGPGIAASDLVLSRAGSGMNDLVLSVAGTTDKLTIQGYFGNAAYRVETLAFADGTSWDYQAVLNWQPPAVDRPPVASSDVAATAEDQALTLASAALLANDTDADGDSLTLVSVGNPAHGTVELVNGSVVFTPEANFNGQASFDYVVRDPKGNTGGATVRVDVAAVNDAPTAVDPSLSTLEDTALVIPASQLLAGATDADGDGLTVLSVENAIGGVLTQTADGSVIFTPDADSSGPAGFSYTISDGHGGTATATATIDVQAVNDAPVAADMAVGHGENALAATFAFDGSDVDTGATLTYTIVSQPEAGTVTNNNDGTFSFNPAGDFETLAQGESRDVTFAYRVVDEHGASSEATATVTISGANDGPVAASVAYGHGENALAATFAFDGSDVDAGAVLAYTIVSQPEAGTVTNNDDGTFSFNPAGGFETLAQGESRDVTFAYRVADEHGASSEATATVTIAGANDGPVAASVAYGQGENALAATFAFDGSDVDAGAVLAYTIVSQPEAGTVTNNDDGTFSFNPAGDFETLAQGESRDVTFAYRVADEHGASSEATATVTIAGANDGPVAASVAYGQGENALAATFAFDGSDVDAGAVLAYTIVSQPEAGTVTNNNDGTFSFNPAGDFETLAQGESRDVNFTYRVTDEHGASSEATATVTIAGANDGPVASSVAYGHTEDAPSVTLAFDGSDVDQGAALTYTIVSEPAEGSVIANGDGSFVFDPAGGFQDLGVGASRSVSFTYRVTDEFGAFAEETATLTVVGTNDGPVAVDDAARTLESTPITVAAADLLANDGDIDSGDALTLLAVDNPVNGAVRLDGHGNVVFSPAFGFAGMASFDMVIADPHGASSRATVEVEVAAVDNTLTATSAVEALDGGAGADTVSYAVSTAAVTANLATGVGSGGFASGDSFARIENIIGSRWNDTLTGNAGANTLTGGRGADRLDGGGGIDTASYAGAVTGVAVDLAAGHGSAGEAFGDRLLSIENVLGSGFADELTGDDGANGLVGGAGDDTLEGSRGADTLDGGTGVDTADYHRSVSAVTVNLAVGSGHGGDAEGDVLSDVENVAGSGGDDILTGDTAANILDGASGDDLLAGGGGADRLDGGSGNDTASYADSWEGVTVDLGTGRGAGGDAEGDVLVSIENLIGSGFADTLIGLSGQNVLEGGGGADVLDGRRGHDTASYAGSWEGVTVDLAAGTGQGGDAGGDTLISIENVRGSGFADLLKGSDRGNVLAGEDGDDTLSGGRGDDRLDGGAGLDTVSYAGAGHGVTVDLDDGWAWGEGSDRIEQVENIVGSSFADDLTGDDGANTLNGGGGSDVLRGGRGADIFAFVRGDGQDEIDNHRRAADGDVVVFGDNIVFDQLWFQKSGKDLVVSVVGTHDRVTVDDWYKSADNHVAAFTTADGHRLEQVSVDVLVQAMAGFNPPPSGQLTLPDPLEQQLAPVLAASWK